MSEYPIRTQIYLSEEMYRELKEHSESQGSSIAQLIREAVAAYLARRSIDEEAYYDDPIWRLPEIGEQLVGSGLRDSAVNHDEYLYGSRRQQ